MTGEDKLIKLYETAMKELYREIAYKEWRGNSTSYQRHLLEKVQEILKQLKKKTPGAVREALKPAYLAGIQDFVKDVGFTLEPQINWRQFNIMIQNTTDQLTLATNRVGRIWQDAIRQAGIKATQHKLAANQTVDQMRRQLLTELYNINPKGRDGQTGIITKRGTMRLDTYAKLVARSTTAEAQNASKLEMAQENGYDLVQFTKHSPTCGVCAQYEDRVFALTKEAANGKYKGPNGELLRFPYLYDTAFVSGYNNIHPNCRHRLVIVVADFLSPQQLANWSKKSMRPFIDNRSERDRKAYAKAQAENRSRWQDRRQWERYRAMLPDQTPANFGAFRVMKRSNSEKWQDLQADCKYLLDQSMAYKGLPLLSNSTESGEIDSRSISAIDNAVRRFGEDFPVVSEWLQYSKFTKEDDEDPASCNFIVDKYGKVSFGLVYNANKWYDYNVAKEIVIKESQSHGHIQTDDPKAIAYHELGHAAHKALALKRVDYDGDNCLPGVQLHCYVDEYSDIMMHMYTMLFGDESYDEICSIIEQKISRRAVQNGAELIAECFSQYYSGKASSIAKRVVKYFMRELKK